MTQQQFTFKNGQTVPSLGFGTWELTGDECVKSVEYALEIGYRHIDTAKNYGNHAEVAKGGKNSGVKREEVFITSKLWRDMMEADKVADACKQTLDELKTDYLDLYLIHWPNREIPVQDTLEAMGNLKEQGLIKSIGVSNFTINHLRDAMATGIEFVNNQVELHPSLSQSELEKFCNENGIILTAYSPIGRGEDLQIEEIKQLAEKYDKSTSQIILNWIISKGMIAIPKSSKPEHIKDNFEAIGWELEKEDIEIIDGLDRNNRIVNPGFGEFDY